MAYTINSGSTPPLATFKQDILELVELFNRGTYPVQTLTPGTIEHLKGIADTSLTTSIVAS